MDIKRELKGLLHPYYLVNIFLCSSYLLAKFVPALCNLFFSGDCELEMKQTEILFFLLVIIMIRARKTGSMGLLAYLSNAFMYCKAANTVLWFISYKPYGIAFVVLLLLQVMILPQPYYKGPQNIVYFSDMKYFKEQLAAKSVVWVIEFYTVWNPACVNFAPIFAELSAEYSLENLKFGKIDLGRFPEIGAEYGISDSAFSKQLPTIILFDSGTQVLRRPTVDSSNKLIKFHLNMQNIVEAFDLRNVYKKCKETPKKTTPAARLKSE